jgi:hypothetical protein
MIAAFFGQGEASFAVPRRSPLGAKTASGIGPQRAPCGHGKMRGVMAIQVFG